MAGRVERFLHRAATSGRLPARTVLDLLIALSPVTDRHKAPSIRRLAVENLLYYRRALAAKDGAVWTSIFSPTELYAAFDLAPLCLEGLAGMLAAVGGEQMFLRGAGTDAVPNTLCTFHRVIIGLGHSGLLPRPRAVVSTSALCDGNAVSFRQLADHHQVPFAFLHIPPAPSTEGVTYLVEQLRALASRLEEITSRQLDMEKLTTAVGHAREAMTLSRRLLAARATRGRNVFPAHQMINLMFPLNAMVGSSELCRLLKALIREVASAPQAADRPAAPAPPVRILWAHIAPLYDYHVVWDVLDNGTRAEIAAEECSHYEPLKEHPADAFEFVARRLIGVPQNGPLDERLERLERLRQEAHADAVVHFSHWGCHQAAGAAPVMQRFFNERQVPFLNLNGDCVDSLAASREQHATRAEAFVESLHRPPR